MGRMHAAAVILLFEIIIAPSCNGLFLKKSIDEFVNVDSTGAGDAFLAGFCYGLYYDYSFRDCIAFGNVTGGKAVTKVGALSGYVTEKALIEYKNKYDEV